MALTRINDHNLYYEVPGEGDPLLCVGSCGTFSHSNHAHLARGLTDRHRVVICDYRGIRDSADDPTEPSPMRLHAENAIGLRNPISAAASGP